MSVKVDESVDPDDSGIPDESVTTGSDVVDEDVDVGVSSEVDEVADVLASSPFAVTQEETRRTRVRHSGKERMVDLDKLETKGKTGCKGIRGHIYAGASTCSSACYDQGRDSGNEESRAEADQRG